jgi:hypothetical protein
MQTLLLDNQSWDLTVDTAGNIAVASDPYSQAQDAASAIRTFEAEVYFDTTLGIPYFQQVLGYAPPLSLLKAYFNSSALTVPGVTNAQSFIISWQDRTIRGQVQIKNDAGQVSAAGF